MLRIIVLFCCAVSLVIASPTPLRSLQNSRINGRIVGGNETTIELNPWQVSIQLLGLHSCGGSIIAPDTIVTAAHCVDAFMSVLYRIVVGTTDLSSPNATVVSIKDAFIHPQYDNNADYDVGIIKLAENLTYSDQIQPIELAAVAPTAGAEVNVTGWGVTSTGNIFTPVILRSVSVNVVDHEECVKDYAQMQVVSDRMICAGVPEGGKDACQGDSGGPLTKDGTLVGIVSWGMGCAEVDYPGVYTDVSTIRDWVIENV